MKLEKQYRRLKKLPATGTVTGLTVAVGLIVLVHTPYINGVMSLVSLCLIALPSAIYAGYSTFRGDNDEKRFRAKYGISPSVNLLSLTKEQWWSLETKEEKNFLLRPTLGPEQDMLVRPAISYQTTDPEQLLRPCAGSED